MFPVVLVNLRGFARLATLSSRDFFLRMLLIFKVFGRGYCAAGSL